MSSATTAKIAGVWCNGASDHDGGGGDGQDRAARDVHSGEARWQLRQDPSGS